MSRQRPRVRWYIGAGAILAAVATVATVALLSGSSAYRALGSADPGALVRIGTSLVRLGVDAAATGCVGSLAFAVLLTTSQRSGSVSAAGYAALRAASRWALAWLVLVVLLIPLDAADTAGLPLHRTLSPAGFVSLTESLEGPKAWLVTAGTVLVVAISCRIVLRWRSAVLLLGLAIVAVLPPLVTAHSSSDTGHDLASTAILIHVPAATLWLGTLIALARLGRYSDVPAPVLLKRYARLALCCWFVLAGSGLVDAAVLASGSSVATSGYGLLLALKVAVVLVIGLVGMRLRRSVLRRATLARGVLSRLVAAELTLLAVTVGMSVGLTRLAPPALVGQPVSSDQTLLGYNLAGPPTMARLLGDWRVDVFFGPLGVLLAVGYLVCRRRLARSGQGWPAARTGAWLAGCAAMILVTCSGVGRYAPAMFSVHLAAHMVLGMLVPVLLALGGPLTLAGRAFRPAPERKLDGPHEWSAAVTSSVLLRRLSHPVMVVTIFSGAPFLVYFTYLFDLAARFHWAHLGLNAGFLVIGYLFGWVTVGADPLPRPVPHIARLGILLAAMPVDIVFGALVIGSHRVLGNGAAGANMYSALELPWVGDLLADQRAAGILALVIAEVSLLVALAALLVHWQREPDEEHPTLVRALRERRTGAGSGPVRAEATQPETVGHHQE